MQVSTPRRWMLDSPAPTAWKHQAAFHKYSRTWTGVDEDVDPHAAAGRFSAGQVQLMAGTVDQHHPGATVGRVALGGLVEDRRDDLLAVGGDRAGQPLGLGVRAGPARALAA